MSVFEIPTQGSPLVNEAKTQVDLGETGHAAGKVVFFYIWTILKRPDGFWKL